MKSKSKWLTVALVNLSVLALLGVTLRCKILFEIPFLDFSNILHAHSHFAFGAWITLCIFSLMIWEMLPAECSSKPVYKWLLVGVLVTSAGMLLTFPFSGYAFFSILFSTLFIFITYIFSWIFIKDLFKSKASWPVKMLSIVALLSLVLSSVGPFTLAYIMASHSANTMLYRDAIYTYLHLQYNGFFTVGIFALFFNGIGNNVSAIGQKNLRSFAIVLSACVLPTLFLSYLWHFDNVAIRTTAILGCLLLAGVLVLFFVMMGSVNGFLKTISPFARIIGFLSMIAFTAKTAIQAGIVFPAVGKMVFGDRPIIIGYLHLVLLGFVTLYLLSHLYQSGHFSGRPRIAKVGITVFASGIIVNEILLMTQGLSFMLMVSSAMYPVLLLGAAVWLLTGTLLISIPALRTLKKSN
jgi:hypothetical protein